MGDYYGRVASGSPEQLLPKSHFLASELGKRRAGGQLLWVDYYVFD